MKAMVCSSDADIDCFDIVAGVLQGDTFSTIYVYTQPKIHITNINSSK